MTAIRESIARSTSALALVLALAPLTRGQVFDYGLQGAASGDYFGFALNRIGDLDQDGCEDFIVGAPGVSLSYDGEATVYSGATGAVIATLSGNSLSALGCAVDGKIDSDGDGYLDVLIGAQHDNTLVSHGGRVAVFSPHLNKILFDLYGGTKYGNFGNSVRSMQGDLDGDNVNDFIVGEYDTDTSYVYSGATGALLFQVNGQFGALSGWSVSNGGDMNGDGVHDFLIGAPTYVDSGGIVTGRVTAWSGKDGTKLWGTNGADTSYFGWSLGHPGDLDGDGLGDCIVGAPNHKDPSSIRTGAVIALSGASGTVLYKVYGNNDNDNFGISVQTVAGDIDDDGTDDFIVGAYQPLYTPGYARLISGAAGGVLFTYTERTTDPTSYGLYGSAVAGGDVNGDGRTDVIIGGEGFDSWRGIVETWTTAVASWSNYGTGWPGTLWTPTLTALNDPVVGQPLTLALTNSAGITTAGLLLVGIASESVPTTKGGTLLVNPLLYVSLSIPGNGLLLTGSIPDDPSLYGFNLYLQALELDPGASKGLSFTPGLDLYLGFD